MDIFDLLDLKKVICMQHKYCTRCPLRVGCKERLLFYLADKNYDQRLQEISAKNGKIFGSLGHSAQEVALHEILYQLIMNKKRQKELELHPTYSCD